MKKRVVYSYVAIFVLIFQMFVPLSTTYAAGGQQVQVDILNVELQGNKETFYNGDSVGITTEWKIPERTQVHPGDYFFLSYPSYLQIAAQTFHMQHGVCEPFGADQMRCTFDERVRDLTHVSGELELGAQLTVVSGSGKQTKPITVNGVSAGTITIDGGSSTGEVGPGGTTGREIGKWGKHSMANPSLINWTVEMNGDKNFYEVRLLDRPQEGHKIVPESISIGINNQIVTKDSPYVKSFHVSEDLIDITLYTYNLDYTVEKYMALIYYDTKIVNPTQKEFKNTATLINNQTSEEIGSKEETVKVWGSASSQGELAKYQGMLKIHKVDEEGQPLAGAIFTLKGMDDSIYTVESDQQGNAKIENLSGGFYTLTEVKAPKGYEIELAFEDIMLNFKEQPIITHKVINKKIEEPTQPEPETPVVPEEPTQPEPETPVVPEEPTQPEPETPVVPEEPTQPEPETPVVPEEPTQPEPETPVVPEEPTQPEPETPVVPEEPTQPEPETPVVPEEPTQPEPETPVVPEEPTQPEPETPVVPEEPTQPEPETPVVPSVPTKPEQPEEEEKPVVVVPEEPKPETPKPSKPSGGGNSSKPSEPTNPAPENPAIPEIPVEEDKPSIVVPEQPTDERPVVKPEQPEEEDKPTETIPESPQEDLEEVTAQPEEIEEKELGEIVVNHHTPISTQPKHPLASQTSNVPTLPQTGEEHMLIMQWAGVLLALLGSVLLFTRKKEA